jgi:hypothetical protein
MKLPFSRLSRERADELSAMTRGTEAVIAARAEGYASKILGIMFGIVAVGELQNASARHKGDPMFQAGAIVVAGLVLAWCVLRLIALMASAVKPALVVTSSAVLKTGIAGEPIEILPRSDVRGASLTHYRRRGSYQYSAIAINAGAAKLTATLYDEGKADAIHTALNSSTVPDRDDPWLAIATGGDAGGGAGTPPISWVGSPVVRLLVGVAIGGAFLLGVKL